MSHSTDPQLAAALDILRAIESAGYTALIVGGAVRDRVMGRPAGDLDLATNMPISELATLFRVHDIGKSKDFGIVAVPHGGYGFEVAQFRGQTRFGDDGRPCGMDEGATFAEDAARRDFTMNAMALDARGAVQDPFGGREDIARKLVRAVGDPAERMAEDPLRALRAVRLAARFGFSIDVATRAAAAGVAPRVSALAPERLAEELLKMAALPGPSFARAVRCMDELGLLGHVLPEVQALKGLPHDPKWHPEGDVYAHTLAALEANSAPDPEVNLAVLLHDVGKAATHQERDGIPTYHGHDRAGVEIIEKLGTRLKLSGDLVRKLSFASAEHMKAAALEEMRPSKVVRLVADPNWTLLKNVTRCDQAARGDPVSVAELDRLLSRAEATAARWVETEGAKARPVITGARVMELTGLSPGPKVGDLLRRVSEWAIDNGVGDPREIESHVLKLAAEG
ncbi:MAG: CCA tRNA nucleotidyltransferase [Deltaproteobacteria bacterium]|nr:CCA tRNA nucleotidyltransferase [Deltaproteobacteria bacterium]